MTDSVAVFRPDDERIEEAVGLLESLGVEPVADPMLTIEPTGAIPRTDADVVIFTSPSAARCLPTDWAPDGATTCAIGPATADALRDFGLEIDVVPEEYSSRGVLEALSDHLEGRRLEVARSDHGSEELPNGLDGAGAYHHETVLYRLTKPADAGESAERAAAGELQAALFTSSLTVEHFLAAAEDRDCREAALDGLEKAVVGAIGEPTRSTAESVGIDVDVVPTSATFESLARAAVDRL